MTDAPAPDGQRRVASTWLPPLKLGEWIVFAVLAALLAAANIYTTLLIGWGDTGSIIAVLLAVVLLGLVGGRVASVEVLNLGQTMVSAGGSVGFALASYAAVNIVEPEFRPDTFQLIGIFAAMGTLGAIIGSSVRKQMVGYFFPSGTACAVIQRSVTRQLEPGERNRPVFLLKVWGSIAALLTIPAKLTFSSPEGQAPLHDLMLLNDEGQAWAGKDVGIGADPLYYGIGIVVGPKVGLGMLLGALAGPFVLQPQLLRAFESDDGYGKWLQWLAIAVMTLPTFATIVFAFLYRQPAVIPPGFTPGRTTYVPPAGRTLAMGVLGILCAFGIAVLADMIFGLPWKVSVITMAIAWPLCIVNGRVSGETDINPVRLVAIVLLSAFAYLITNGSIAMLGMAIVGGTLAAVAVDMMQDYRTGFLVDADPVHQTSVQFAGSLVGALVAVPVLYMLLDKLGLGEGSSLPAPGAQIWARMAGDMAAAMETGELNLPAGLLTAVIVTSVVGCGYAFLTVWPRTSRWMPSLFGFGIGMLVGVATSSAIFLGGLIKWIVTLVYAGGKAGEARAEAQENAGNDTMLAGASVFAAAAILSIVLVIASVIHDRLGGDSFWIASH